VLENWGNLKKMPSLRGKSVHPIIKWGK
jgi:hypothetical protein